MNKKVNIQKLAIAGVLVALGVVTSTLNFPIGASKCAPMQHMINVLAATVLGPWYGVAMAFLTSLLRNLFGLGTLLAFPGSIFGALLSGIFFQYLFKKQSFIKRIPLAFIGEIIGTGIIGAIAAYPIAKFIMISDTATIFGFVVPFLISCSVGALIASILVFALAKTGALKYVTGEFRTAQNK